MWFSSVFLESNGESDHRMAKNFHEVVNLIMREDPRYERGAYLLVREGLDATLRTRKSGRGRQPAHVSGRQLSEGLRTHILDQYGPMAKTLLETWGIRSTEDFGNIVFTLIDYGILAKNEDDRIEDFREVFDFEEAFEFPFLSKDDRRARKRIREMRLRPAERPDTN